jgi:hypothetical protein
MRKNPVGPSYHPLPIKPQGCPHCHFISTLGAAELQQHLDREHKGWAERTISKMDIRKPE